MSRRTLLPADYTAADKHMDGRIMNAYHASARTYQQLLLEKHRALVTLFSGNEMNSELSLESSGDVGSLMYGEWKAAMAMHPQGQFAELVGIARACDLETFTQLIFEETQGPALNLLSDWLAACAEYQTYNDRWERRRKNFLKWNTQAVDDRLASKMSLILTLEDESAAILTEYSSISDLSAITATYEDGRKIPEELQSASTSQSTG